MHLKPTQMRAVSHENSPYLVLVDSGSGKTAVITRRVQVLIHDMAVSPGHVFVITFMRAAAAEMKEWSLKAKELNGTAVTLGLFTVSF